MSTKRTIVTENGVIEVTEDKFSKIIKSVHSGNFLLEYIKIEKITEDQIRKQKKIF